MSKDFFYSNVGTGLIDGNIDYSIKRFSLYDGVQSVPPVQVKTKLAYLESFCHAHNRDFRKLASQAAGHLVLLGESDGHTVVAVVASIGKGGQNARRAEDFYLEGCVVLSDVNDLRDDMDWQMAVACDELMSWLPKFASLQRANLEDWLRRLAAGEMSPQELLPLLENNLPVHEKRTTHAASSKMPAFPGSKILTALLACVAVSCVILYNRIGKNEEELAVLAKKLASSQQDNRKMAAEISGCLRQIEELQKEVRESVIASQESTNSLRQLKIAALTAEKDIVALHANIGQALLPLLKVYWGAQIESAYFAVWDQFLDKCEEHKQGKYIFDFDDRDFTSMDQAAWGFCKEKLASHSLITAEEIKDIEQNSNLPKIFHKLQNKLNVLVQDASIPLKACQAERGNGYARYLLQNHEKSSLFKHKLLRRWALEDMCKEFVINLEMKRLAQKICTQLDAELQQLQASSNK